MEKARQCHDSKLLSKAVKAWNKHHNQYQKNKVVTSFPFNCCIKPHCCLLNASFEKCDYFIGNETTGNPSPEIKDVPDVL